MSYILSILPALTSGLAITFEVFVVTLVFSIPLGLIVAIGRISKINIVSRVVQLYILIMRGTPLLLQLVVVFFVTGPHIESSDLGRRYINIVIAGKEIFPS